MDVWGRPLGQGGEEKEEEKNDEILQQFSRLLIAILGLV